MGTHLIEKCWQFCCLNVSMIENTKNQLSTFNSKSWVSMNPCSPVRWAYGWQEKNLGLDNNPVTMVRRIKIPHAEQVNVKKECDYISKNTSLNMWTPQKKDRTWKKTKEETVARRFRAVTMLQVATYASHISMLPSEESTNFPHFSLSWPRNIDFFNYQYLWFFIVIHFIHIVIQIILHLILSKYILIIEIFFYLAFHSYRKH